MEKVLIADDERSIRKTLSEILEYEGYRVECANSGEEALRLIEENEYNLLICDVKMGKVDGYEVLIKSKKTKPELQIVMMSGHGNINLAVECLKHGAFDFIEKPLDVKRIISTVHNAVTSNDSETAEDKQNGSKRTTKHTSNSIPEIVGKSEAINHVKKMVEKLAKTDARVLITGSNGTGKELVARWLHQLGDRASLPFVEVNCAAIPSELIESEMFGHEKGSFTNAVKCRKGKFEQAQNGTLFLDEVGDMSLSAQCKLLRALQEKKITRVGGEKSIDIDVRIIAATNKNLLEEIKNGNFREDLYHRLSVVIVNVPSLDERKEDIPLLVNHFINNICKERGIPPRKITDSAIQSLVNMNWSGNIRQLCNIVERLVIFSDSTDLIDENTVTEYV